MKPEDIPMGELKTFALDFAEEGDLDGVKRALDAIERAAFKAGVEAMFDQVVSDRMDFGIRAQATYERFALNLKNQALAQLDKETTDGKAE